MIKILFNLVVFLFAFNFLTFCKKKTEIKVVVFNPYLQNNVMDAKVSIMEYHKSNFFTSGWGKTYDKQKEIAYGYTDNNGEVFFNDEKLRINSNYEYAVRVTETWGIKNKNIDPSDYPNLRKGKTNNIIVSDYTKGKVSIQFNNLFTTGQSGDSICIFPQWYDLYDPRTNQYIKGAGIESIVMPYDLYSSYPSNYSINGYEDHAYGKALLTIRKRKLGLLSLDTIIVQFYPNQTTLVTINW